MVKVKKRKGVDSENTFPQIPERCYPVNKKITSYDFSKLKKDLDYGYYLNMIVEKLDIPWKDVYNNPVTQFEY